jgi:predicted class III extradiol MEMO1 family dioxygenase
MFHETRACGPGPVKVIMESSRSLGAYKRIQFQHFFINEVHISSEIDHI